MVHGGFVFHVLVYQAFHGFVKMQGFFRVKSAAEFCDVSARTVRSWLKSGLKHSVIGGVYLIRKEDIDAFIESHVHADNQQVDIIVNEIIKEVNK
ncbi:helix-turn-helix domain-containing protein [Gemmatimonadota bacterium]